MKHPYLFAYQAAIGVSDTCTGALLYIAPLASLRLMGLTAPADAAPFIAYIGAFVFAVGLSCLYGAWLFAADARCERTEVVWLLTAIIRSAVAIYILQAVFVGSLGKMWLTVAIFDGGCAAIQAIGLWRRWLADAR